MVAGHRCEGFETRVHGGDEENGAQQNATRRAEGSENARARFEKPRARPVINAAASKRKVSVGTVLRNFSGQSANREGVLGPPQSCFLVHVLDAVRLA